MRTRTDKKLIYYVALFIALLLNSYKLMALREGALIRQYWHFNGFELLFEFAWNFMFCISCARLTFYLAGKYKLSTTSAIIGIALNVMLFTVADAIGIYVQQELFLNQTPSRIFWMGSSVRMLASQALMVLLAKILLLMHHAEATQTENEHLRNANLSSQLELLKEKLNPHFFFNTLSSLSAIVYENPRLAQEYIKHLSKIFRYVLTAHENDMASVSEELDVFYSQSELLKMRFEEGVIVKINVADEYLDYILPYMSLQPLLENAAKHNIASTASPLEICLYIEDGKLVVENNLQPTHTNIESTGIGLKNLSERFVILMNQDFVIQKTEKYFIVKLPLQHR